MLLKTVSNLMADLNVVSNLEYFMLPRTSSHIFGAKNAVRHGRQMRMRESQIVWTQNGWSQMIHEGTEDTQETKTQNSNSAGHLYAFEFTWLDNGQHRKKGKADQEKLWFLIFIGMYLCTHAKEIIDSAWNDFWNNLETLTLNLSVTKSLQCVSA